MNDITLMSVNWNTRPCLELMLKSYVKHHYTDQPLRLALWDNNSFDGSDVFLKENNIPFDAYTDNIGHEQAINVMYPLIKTRYVLLVDTDIIFNDNCWVYIDFLKNGTIAAGDLIRGDNLGSAVKPRLGAWFILFDITNCRAHGINTFRDTGDWSYDVGSHFYERLWMQNLGVHIIPRLPGHIDYDIEGMKYGTHSHLGKMSWNLEKHGDRKDEVYRRRVYVEERLKDFADVDLTNKFIV